MAKHTLSVHKAKHVVKGKFVTDADRHDKEQEQPVPEDKQSGSDNETKTVA